MSNLIHLPYAPGHLVTLANQALSSHRITPAICIAYAHMLWIGSSSHRIHIADSSASSFSQQWIQSLFGRSGFQRINNILAWFVISDDWQFQVTGNGSGKTKRYWISDPGFEALRLAYLDSSLGEPNFSNEPTWFSRGQAILGTDIDGNRVRRWPRSRIRKLVAIDTNAILAEIRGLNSFINQPDFVPAKIDGGVTNVMKGLDRPLLKRRRAQLHGLCMLIRTNVDQAFAIPVQYIEYRSGRLYTRGLSLQNIRSDYKASALFGSWEYDFANCHYQLLYYFAKRQGFRATHIEHYCQNKSEIREEIAAALGKDLKIVKQAMISIVYGARLSLARESTLRKLLGLDSASEFLGNPTVKGLIEDLKESKNLLLSQARKTRSGHIVNLAGKVMAIRGQKRDQQIAHLLQGAESAFLDVVVTETAESVVLLQHDGFTTDQECDLKLLDQAMHQKFGFSIPLEHKQFSQQLVLELSTPGYLDILEKHL